MRGIRSVVLQISAAAGVLLGGSVAHGADLPTLAEVNLEATVNDLVGLTLNEEPRLLVAGPGRLWLIHPTTGQVLSSLPSGADAVAAGTLGDLWACSSDGLARITFDGDAVNNRTIVDPVPCRDVGLVATSEGMSVVAAGKAVRVFRIAQDGSVALDRALDAAIEGWPLLAVDGKRFAVAAGGLLLEEGPWGASRLATGGEVGGLVAGTSSWVWSLPGEAALVDVTRRRTSVAARPGHLALGDIDGDAIDDLIVAHPDSDQLGLLLGQSGKEVLVRGVPGTRRVLAWDADGDGCKDVSVLGASGRLRVMGGSCAGAPLTSADATPSPDPSGGSPAVSGEQGQLRRDLIVGADPPPVVNLVAGDRVDLRLRDAEGTASAWAASGGPTGLVVTSSGTVMYRSRSQDVGRWRVNLRLWENGGWSRHTGFDLVVLPSEGGPAGEDRIGLGVSDISRALDEEVGKLDRPLGLRGCSFGVGGAFGGSAVQESWTRLGQSFLVSGSPAVAVTCDGGTGSDEGFWWYGGLDMAPWFVYVVADTGLRHGLAASVGGGYTRGDLYAGVSGTAGATILGFGPIVRWLPFERENGRRHGPEVRVMWIPADEFIVEGMVLYTMQLGRYR